MVSVQKQFPGRQAADVVARNVWYAVLGPIWMKFGYVRLAKDLFEFWMAQPTSRTRAYFEMHRIPNLLRIPKIPEGSHLQLACDQRVFLCEEGARGTLIRCELLGEGVARPLEAEYDESF